MESRSKIDSRNRKESAAQLFIKHANLRYKYEDRHFSAEGYYVSIVGLNKAIIQKYIRDQENDDLMIDKTSVREHEDPFKGRQSDNCGWLNQRAFCGAAGSSPIRAHITGRV
ncbi:MAG: hypothetical protein HPY74_05645 [Firmicutes bacterium]|nr:hypothetical protein [Bacillota bacterium]